MTLQPDTSTDAWTIGRLLSWTSEHLSGHGVEDARLSAEVLLSKAIGCRRIDLYARFDQTPEEELLAKFREWVKRAAAREPVAYLVEEKEFFSLPFRVTADVLIPRPETEVLVETAIDHTARSGRDTFSILDIGTGSGCIAISLLTQLDQATAVATDISPAALEVARSNAERHGVANRLTLIEADRLALPLETIPEGGFDLIVSNPPYVRLDDVSGLDETVRTFEPSHALTDGGDGLSFYRSLAARVSPLLADHGVVIVEVGDEQSSVVSKIVEDGGLLVHRRTVVDRVVGSERVLVFSALDGEAK